MKNFLLGFSIVITLLTSCSTNLNIDAPYKDVTVVYGLLDPNDSVQYIRIEKGFINPAKSAVTLAQNPDSIYYPPNALKVQLVSSNTNTTYNLAYSTNVPKDTGAFANTPNVLYETNQPIDPTQNYNLVITNTSTGKVISSQTSIVGNFTVSSPLQDTTANSLDLAGFNQDGSPKQVDVTWTSGNNGVDYSLDILFYYQQWPISNKSAVTDTFVDWPVFSNITTNDLATTAGLPLFYNITGNDFYYFLASALPVNPNVQRAPLGRPLVFKFTEGGLTLYDYLLVSEAATSLAAIQALPSYTNINNGIGLFSSRTTQEVTQVGLNANALDSLACGSITGKLNFVIQGTPCYQ